jgi:glucose-6-phosphate isomerase
VEIDLTKLTPDIRHLDDMRGVLFDQEYAKTAGNLPLYFMYRGIKEENGIRYDITAVPAKMLGKEFVKTKGHYHIGKYQEVYTVLEGQAIYLMQKKMSDSQIQDVYTVHAKKGDVIVIPSDYGHISINPSLTEELKMANWIASECKSDYSFFEKNQGACYYYVIEPESGQATWIKNEHYKNVPPLRFEQPLKEVPKNLEFLKVK